MCYNSEPSIYVSRDVFGLQRISYKFDGTTYKEVSVVCITQRIKSDLSLISTVSFLMCLNFGDW